MAFDEKKELGVGGKGARRQCMAVTDSFRDPETVLSMGGRGKRILTQRGFVWGSGRENLVGDTKSQVCSRSQDFDQQKRVYAKMKSNIGTPRRRD